MDECGVNHNCNEAAASEDHSGTECRRPPEQFAVDGSRFGICKICQEDSLILSNYRCLSLFDQLVDSTHIYRTSHGTHAKFRWYWERLSSSLIYINLYTALATCWPRVVTVEFLEVALGLFNLCQCRSRMRSAFVDSSCFEKNVREDKFKWSFTWFDKNEVT